MQNNQSSWSRGAPFNNQGAGRIKTSPQNQSRISLILSTFESSPLGVSLLSPHQSQRVVTKPQIQRYKYLFPLTGFLIGLGGSYSFVHPSSKYIGKLFTVLMTVVGYQQYLIKKETYEFSRRVGMWAYYPKEIQRMLENNDWRYGREWLGRKAEKWDGEKENEKNRETQKEKEKARK